MTVSHVGSIGKNTKGNEIILFLSKSRLDYYLSEFFPPLHIFILQHFTALLF